MREPETIRKFKAFHINNPAIYTWFKYFMLQMLEKKRKVSAKLAYERTRWEVFVECEVEPDEEYKMNNNYHAGYSRLFLKEHPHYKDLVETRKSIFDLMD